MLGIEGTEPGPQETGGTSGSSAYRGWAEDRCLLETEKESCEGQAATAPREGKGEGVLHEKQQGTAFPWRELLWGKEGEISFKGEEEWFYFSEC